MTGLTGGSEARRDLLFAIGIAWLMVIARSAVYLVHEHAFFDSDQAIFGLMAKHLIEGRAWPLFVYGQTYMLVVDTWIAVPFFLVGGYTVAALHASLVFSNLVTVTVLLVSLSRHAQLGPWWSLAAVTPLAFVPPDTAASLLEAAGNVGPLLYVPLLWLLRNRPVWFGLVLGVGLLHREFTVYAVPVLLVHEAWRRTLFGWGRIRHWMLAFAVALGTWQAAQALRPYADSMGPGTRGMPIPGAAGVGAVTDRIEFVAAELPERITTMVRESLPGLLGGRLRRTPIAVQGHDWLFGPLMAIVATGLIAGLVVLIRERRGAAQARAAADLPLYLYGVGTLAVIGYIVTRPSDFFQDRYMLLALYLPVAAAALVFASPLRWARLPVLACIVALGIGSAVDHRQQWTRYQSGHEPNDLRVLADTLVARGISVGISGYWRAYKLSFLTGERVKIASSDYIRIEEYQRLAREAGEGLVTISTTRCPGGELIAGHYLCRSSP